MYLVDHFLLVCMSTTKRFEGMNNIVEMKIKSYFMLLEFMMKYEGGSLQQFMGKRMPKTMRGSMLPKKP